MLLYYTKIVSVMMLSVCGLKCDECEFFLEKRCPGCTAVKGSTFWAKEMMPGKVCPLYDCSVNGKNYSDCGDCSELPCKLFREMKDPNISDEEHQKSLLIRIAALRSN
jgi:hypothetical protein